MSDGFDVINRVPWQEAAGAWRRLVERYADGRQICNCGNSYYAFRGDRHFCPGGCQASCYAVKDEIAARVWQELATRNNT